MDRDTALLTLADRIDEADERPIVIHHGAAAELRRLVAENKALKEALKEAEKVDADANTLAASSGELANSVDALLTLNAELAEALRGWMNQPEDAATYDACMARAEAALAKVEANNGS